MVHFKCEGCQNVTQLTEDVPAKLSCQSCGSDNISFMIKVKVSPPESTLVHEIEANTAINSKDILGRSRVGVVKAMGGRGRRSASSSEPDTDPNAPEPPE